VSHGVYRPRVFNDEKWYPLPFVDVKEIPTAERDCDGVYDKKCRVEFEFMA
jgi:hypothetical protein